MARFATPWMRPLSRKEWISAGAILALVVGYFTTLSEMDGRAEAYFRETRATDPELYLEQLRAGRGFGAFLPEYAELNGFDKLAPHAPDFLIGRWTMRTEALRLTPGERPDKCSDPITFDYGLVLMVEPDSATLPVSYLISDGKVELHNLQNDDIYAVTPISFGSQIDHLEFVPPGRSEPVLAYLCAG